MKQIIQSFKTGELSITEVPVPALDSQDVLVRTSASLVSAGTERMLVDFAEKSLLQKARSRPDLVRQVVDKARREGALTTLEAVFNRLDKPISLGYSSAGYVVDVGSQVTLFQIGDRVACSGAGYANHAEVVCVPENLVVKVPEAVDLELASFATVGAIALQGIRLTNVKLGEVVAVIGLGLLGQLTGQMLKAAGCIVIGYDPQPQRAVLARRLGIDFAVATLDEFSVNCSQLSDGHGADAVFITADTKSDQPIEVAGEVARDKGVVVAVGSVGLNIPRKVYFDKELNLHISRSTGPGRYDPEYEEKGRDYPYAYVRWTEQRNMQAFLYMVAEGRVQLAPLLTHRFPIADASKAYELITGKGGETFLGVLLTYPELPDLSRTVRLGRDSDRASEGGRASNLSMAPEQIGLGIIGAGLFANATLLPAIKGVPIIKPIGIASGNGLSARAAADRYGFNYCTTDEQEILNDPRVNTVAILTRHHLHARQVIAALTAGKNVFVEKPLCLNEAELREIMLTYQGVASERSMNNGDAARQRAPLLMVGFNRRFAPFVLELKRCLQKVQEPLMLNYRVNAGYIPPEHWTQDVEQGGGRLLGEGCHFIDLLIYLSGSKPRRVNVRSLPDSGRYSRDNLLITLEFANGSLGTVTYVANGNKKFSKEFLEVFGGGLSARLDDYRSLVIQHGMTRVKRVARLRQDKGHRPEWEALAAYLIGKGPQPMTFEEIMLSTNSTLAAQYSLLSGETVTLEQEENHPEVEPDSPVSPSAFY